MDPSLSVDMASNPPERRGTVSGDLSLSSGDNVVNGLEEDHPSLRLELKLPCSRPSAMFLSTEPSSGELAWRENIYLSNINRPLISPNQSRNGGAGSSSATSDYRIRSRRSHLETSCDDDGRSGHARKKLRLSKEQSCYLEESFKEHAIPNPNQKLLIAKKLNLGPRQVEVWFQNRRARTKLKKTENDLEYLKQRCEYLTNVNRRLQHEIQELKFTLPPPRLCSPATALLLCPSCGRKAVAETGRQ